MVNDSQSTSSRVSCGLFSGFGSGSGVLAGLEYAGAIGFDVMSESESKISLIEFRIV